MTNFFQYILKISDFIYLSPKLESVKLVKNKNTFKSYKSNLKNC